MLRWFTLCFVKWLLGRLCRQIEGSVDQADILIGDAVEFVIGFARSFWLLYRHLVVALLSLVTLGAIS